jgi:hypothetical protein
VPLGYSFHHISNHQYRLHISILVNVQSASPTIDIRTFNPFLKTPLSAALNCCRCVDLESARGKDAETGVVELYWWRTKVTSRHTLFCEAQGRGGRGVKTGGPRRR